MYVIHMHTHINIYYRRWWCLSWCISVFADGVICDLLKYLYIANFECINCSKMILFMVLAKFTVQCNRIQNMHFRDYCCY